MRIAIHQPNYMAYPGFFHKMSQCDKFIILDTCNMKRSTGSNNHENRNRIKTADGIKWLTVPIEAGRKHGIAFKDAHIVGDDWKEEQLRKIKAAYRGAHCFEEGMSLMRTIFLPEHRTMAGLGIYSIQMIARAIGIYPNTGIEIASSRKDHIPSSGTEALVGLCEAFGATEYLSGSGGRDYLDEDLFLEEGITVVWQEYEPITYIQQHGDFEPNLSTIDAIFNIGAKHTGSIIKGA